MPDPKKMAELIVGGGAPPPDAAPDDGGDMGLQAAAEDLLAAVESKDASGVAAALKAAFELLDSAAPGEAAENEG